MYQLDPNTHTAIERQADRVRAVQAYGSRESPEQAAPTWGADSTPRTNRVASKAILALGAATPIVLIVVVALIVR